MAEVKAKCGVSVANASWSLDKTMISYENNPGVLWISFSCFFGYANKDAVIKLSFFKIINKVFVLWHSIK